MRKIKKYITAIRRLIVIIVLIAITFSYAMFQGGFVSWFLFYSLIPFLIYSLLLAVVPFKFVQVRREITPSKLSSGDTVSVKVSFQNRSWFPLVFIAIKEIDMDDWFYIKTKGKSSNIFFVGWKRNFEWTYELVDVERGEIVFKGLHLTITDFFGWTIRHKVIGERQASIVYPKITNMKFNNVQMRYDRGGAPSPYSLVKDTSAVSGIREYQPGDRYSSIHWKSFAKNETLRTKEFENQQTQELFLVLDKTSPVNFELAVELVASILQAAIKNRRDLSLLSFGENRSYFPKVKSQVQLEKIMHHLAVVKPETQGLKHSALINELSLISSSSLLIVTGNITETLKNLLTNYTKIAQNVVCFVVIENESQKIIKSQVKFPNVKIIYLTKELFPNAFAEVVKP